VAATAVAAADDTKQNSRTQPLLATAEIHTEPRPLSVVRAQAVFDGAPAGAEHWKSKTGSGTFKRRLLTPFWDQLYYLFPLLLRRSE
jgi:hypothetical protein